MQPYEIIISPADVYLAPSGSTFPDVDTPPTGTWKLLGTAGKKNYSEDGVTVTHEQTLEPHRTAGSTGPVKVARTEEGLTFEGVLEDLSLEEYAKVLNDVTVADVAAASGTPGYRSIPLRQGLDVAEFAMLVRFPSPYGDGFTAQYQVPRVYQAANPAPAFNKSGAAGLAFSFTALEDPDATVDEERFGKLVAQDALAT